MQLSKVAYFHYTIRNYQIQVQYTIRMLLSKEEYSILMTLNQILLRLLLQIQWLLMVELFISMENKILTLNPLLSLQPMPNKVVLLDILWKSQVSAPLQTFIPYQLILLQLPSNPYLQLSNQFKTEEPFSSIQSRSQQLLLTKLNYKTL